MLFSFILLVGLCFAIEPMVSANGVDNVTRATSGGSYSTCIRDKNEPPSQEVYLGGNPIGIRLNAGALIFIDRIPIATKQGFKLPAMVGELKKGDKIVQINKQCVSKTNDLNRILNGEQLELEVLRGSYKFCVKVDPLQERRTGAWKLGMVLKEEVNGIGTMTFITKDGKFKALGHKIVDPESGLSGELNNGEIFEAVITGIKKGKRGQAGELQGGFSNLAEPVGNIRKNTCFGLKGNYSGVTKNLQKIWTASKYDIKLGKAKIFSTIEGTKPKLYDVEIVRCSPKQSKSEKGMTILVTDKRLLNKTGGIVQGMSGSPIVQNGKLVGAVTHVFINNPRRGYGIFASSMMD